MLDRFDYLPVTALDVAHGRVNDINAVQNGGISRVSAVLGDVTQTDLGTDAYDVVTALEVLEHLHQPGMACRRILAAARRFVVASVPSKPDNNPEHIQFFKPDDLVSMFKDAGAAKVSIDHVHNHMIAVVRK